MIACVLLSQLRCSSYAQFAKALPYISVNVDTKV